MNCGFEKCRNQGMFDKFYSGPFGLKQRGNKKRMPDEFDGADISRVVSGGNSQAIRICKQ